MRSAAVHRQVKCRTHSEKLWVRNLAMDMNLLHKQESALHVEDYQITYFSLENKHFIWELPWQSIFFKRLLSKLALFEEIDDF